MVLIVSVPEFTDLLFLENKKIISIAWHFPVFLIHLPTSHNCVPHRCLKVEHSHNLSVNDPIRLTMEKKQKFFI